MTAELFALLHGFDIGVPLQDLVSEILGRKVVMKLKLYTDSHTCWDAVTSLFSTTEKPLLIGLFGIREAYRTGVLEYLC
jgi:hypothetical protein